MGIIKKRAYDLDFSHFEEEIIILMAQSGSWLARNELIDRYFPRVKKQVDRLARLKRLPKDEVADFEQNAVFAMDEGIRKYRLAPPTLSPQGRGPRGDENRCTLGSYLYRLVQCQFLNNLKSFRRKAKHTDSSDRAKRAFDLLAEGPGPRRSGSWRNEKRGKGFQVQRIEPAADAEAKEFQQRWSRAVARLTREHRRIYEACISGKSIRLIAQNLGLPERTLYEKKRAMLVRLRAHLGAE
jgi:hypothetical protein